MATDDVMIRKNKQWPMKRRLPMTILTFVVRLVSQFTSGTYQRKDQEEMEGGKGEEEACGLQKEGGWERSYVDKEAGMADEN